MSTVNKKSSEIAFRIVGDVISGGFCHKIIAFRGHF
jgi:hypothetical protein